MGKRNALITYIERHSVGGELLWVSTTRPDMVVVIPCFDELSILETLTSLRQAAITDFTVEVIVVVNSGEHTPKAIVSQNRITYEALLLEAESWCGNLLLSPVLIENVRRKHAGVGYARKVGMDLAVARFAQHDNPDGVIVSLDADTTVASNYFLEIYASFQNAPQQYGVIVKFEHSVDRSVYSEEVCAAITHYELHLRYVNQALKMSGFPYVHHTVGSAFAVRASAYAAHGGMNRRQGGEDFYFLHKLFPHGEFKELNTTAVYPSSRPSHRVPFGTGPQVDEFLNTHELLTYNLDAFLSLKAFLAVVPSFYDEADVNSSPEIQDFLNTISFDEKVKEIRSNSASERAFVKRFFAYFDAFKVVKFLNFSHQDYFSKKDIKVESARLLSLLEEETPDAALDLLLSYRKIEGR